MKIILGANISANGRILPEEDPNHQAPHEATNFLMQKAIEAGNLVIGRKTYDFILEFMGGIEQALPGVEIVMLSTGNGLIEGVKIARSPEEAIRYLTGKGFSEIAIGGGTMTYNAFLDKGLVTDIYFNILPIITGSGGVLATDDTLLARFSQIQHNPLGDGFVQIHLTR